MLIELFPTRTRYTGVAFGYNIGQAVLGGTAPLVGTALIELTGNKLAPSFYLIACAIVAGVARALYQAAASRAVGRCALMGFCKAEVGGTATSPVLPRSLMVSFDCLWRFLLLNLTGWQEPMDVLAKRLDQKLREWAPATAKQVRSRIMEIIELADQNLLDIARSRKVEQEVLDLLDEPPSR